MEMRVMNNVIKFKAPESTLYNLAWIVEYQLWNLTAGGWVRTQQDGGNIRLESSYIRGSEIGKFFISEDYQMRLIK